MKAEELSRTVHVSARRRNSSRRRQPDRTAMPGRANARWSTNIRRADPIHASAPAARRRRAQRLGAHRRHHQLHEHQQPERHARRRSAGEKGRGTRPDASIRTVKASLAPGSRVVTRLSEQDRAAAVSRQARLSTSSATAARPASAIPARCIRAIEDAIVKNDLVAASVLVRQPQFRGARASEHQGEFSHVAAAGGRVRAGGRVDIDLSHEPLGTGKDGAAGLPARPLADACRKSAT